MKKFETGKGYWTRSICDHECIISLKVKSRTAKTITTTVHGEEKVFRIKVWDGVEQVRPWGTYSMCPIIGADKEGKPS
jgi:hypothetical protein